VPDLDTLLRQRPTFTLEELADAANELLDGLLPHAMSDSRVKAEVNPRLIRHYVSEEMLDPALREGRHAVYTVDHLLQLLALRRLLADGYSSTLIGSSLRERGRDDLRAIAEGREVAAETDESGGGQASSARSEARAALDEIRGRASTGRASSRRQRPASAPPLDLSIRSYASRRPPSASSGASDPSSETRTWERVPLLDGVELHVRSDLRLPDSAEERQRLLDHVVREIIRYAQRRDA